MRRDAARTACRWIALVAVVILQTAWWMHPVPIAGKVVAGLFVLLGLVSPPSALLALAGLAPFSTVLAGLTEVSYGGPKLLEQMALSCVVGVLLRASSTTTTRSQIGWPAAVVAVVAVASAITLLPTRALAAGPELGAPVFLVQSFFDGSYATSDPIWSPLLAAMLVLEGALLAWTVERQVRQTPGLAERLLLMLLIAHAGTSLLSFYRIVAAASAGGDVMSAFPGLFARARVSMQMDFNAAGSTLLLALIAGVGLCSGSWLRRIAVVALMGMTLVGLWLTGSRVALLAGLIGIACGAGWLAVRRGGTARLVATGCVVLMFVGGAVLVAAYPRGRNPTVEHSFDSRMILIRAGFTMFRSAPAFGVGIAQFFNLSGPIAGAELRPYGHSRENAHNNFVQVLAEQGLAGLGALALLLSVVFAAAIRTELLAPDWSRLWLTVAMLASVLTWTTGHPLMVPEYSFVFWLCLGALAGLSKPPPARPPQNIVAMVAVAAVLLSVPMRAVQVRDAADLEHLGFALSEWKHDDQQRYREGGSRFTIFLPTSDRPNLVPVRRTPGSTALLRIEFRRGDVLVATASLNDDAWHSVEIRLAPSARRFEQIEVAVSGASADAGAAAARIRVGRDALAP